MVISDSNNVFETITNQIFYLAVSLLGLMSFIIPCSSYFPTIHFHFLAFSFRIMKQKIKTQSNEYLQTLIEVQSGTKLG